jgi:hypothetical protein
MTPEEIVQLIKQLDKLQKEFEKLRENNTRLTDLTGRAAKMIEDLRSEKDAIERLVSPLREEIERLQSELRVEKEVNSNLALNNRSLRLVAMCEWDQAKRTEIVKEHIAGNCGLGMADPDSEATQISGQLHFVEDFIADANNMCVAQAMVDDKSLLKRLTACWNLCEGINTEVIAASAGQPIIILPEHMFNELEARSGRMVDFFEHIMPEIAEVCIESARKDLTDSILQKLSEFTLANRRYREASNRASKK